MRTCLCSCVTSCGASRPRPPRSSPGSSTSATTGRREARIEPELVDALLRHSFTHHLRELERLLWLAIGTATGDFIGLTSQVEAELRDSAESTTEVAEVDRETLVRALADNERSPTRTAKALGLKNRYVLIRLLKKHGLSAAGSDDKDEG